VVPAIASADLTVGGATPTSITGAACTYTFTGTNGNLDETDADNCIEGSSGLTVIDQSSSNNIDLSSLDAASCGGGGTITIESESGEIEVDPGASVELSGDCTLTLDASTTLSEGVDATIDVNDLAAETVLGAGGADLDQSGNEIGTISTIGSGVNGDFTVNDEGSLAVANVDAVNLTLTSAGEITESSGDAINADQLSVSSYEGTLLNGQNQVEEFTADSADGAVELSDDDPVILNLGGVTAGDGVNVTDAGDITVSDTLETDTGDVDLISDGGTVTETVGQGTISAPVLDAEGDADSVVTSNGAGDVTLNGDNNSISTLQGSANYGNFEVNLNAETTNLGDISTPEGFVNLTSYYDPGGSLEVAGTVSASSSVTLAAHQDGGGTITETDTGAIDAATLGTSSGGSTTLNTSGAVNDVGSFEGQSNAGDVDLGDTYTGTLDITGILPAPEGISITNTGGIELVASVNAGTGPALLASQDGSVTAGSSASVTAASLTASGDSVSLPAENYVGTFSATATDGGVTAGVYEYEASAALGQIQATGSVSVTSDYYEGRALALTGTISGQSIALDASGIAAASGNSAVLSAPSISITDTDATDPWTVTPSTIAAEGTGTIAYSDASSLSITGGASFNVTPSALTTMTFDGGDPAAATLIYNAGGRVVSGTTTAPSGTIDATGVEPVIFSGMTAVTVNDPGTASPPNTNPTTTTPPTTTTTPPTTTTTTTPPTTTTPSPSSNPPTCTLRASSSKVAVPKKVHGKIKGKATLTFVATCSSAVHTILSAGITVVWKPLHSKKKKSKFYPIPGVRASLAANGATKIVLDVPSGVVTALSTKGDALSARATLVDTDHGDSVLKTTTLARLT
jgi:hypothetical protein